VAIYPHQAVSHDSSHTQMPIFYSNNIFTTIIPHHLLHHLANPTSPYSISILFSIHQEINHHLHFFYPFAYLSLSLLFLEPSSYWLFLMYLLLILKQYHTIFLYLSIIIFYININHINIISICISYLDFLYLLQ
jgi:hypothetical protein